MSIVRELKRRNVFRMAVLSAIRRAPQLGQKPRFYDVNGFTNAVGAGMRRNGQLKATNFSSWQDSHRTLRKPCSSLPHFRYSLALREVFMQYVRQDGSVWAPSSAWIITAYNPA